MAEIIRKLIQGYQIVFIEWTDPATNIWPLVAKPYQGLLLLGLYLMFVLKWGPQWMKNRPAFSLKEIIMIYNGLQVIACMFIFVMALRYGWGWKYKWICEPVDFSQSENALLARRLTYYYFLLKVADLTDTVFFVLRKKFNQVSFLHVYHHCGMVMLIWGSITYLPGGHASLVGVINCFVHVIMYSYYFLTVAVPSVKQSLWWKKHITQLQIAQFFCCVVHISILVFKSDCEYPRWVAAVFLPQNIFMLILFIDFYIKTYIKKPQTVKNGDSKNLNNTYSIRNSHSTNNNSINGSISQKGKAN